MKRIIALNEGPPSNRQHGPDLVFVLLHGLQGAGFHHRVDVGRCGEAFDGLARAGHDPPGVGEVPHFHAVFLLQGVQRLVREGLGPRIAIFFTEMRFTLFPDGRYNWSADKVIPSTYYTQATDVRGHINMLKTSRCTEVN